MDIQLNNAPCGYFSISSAGILVAINQTFLDMLVFEREQLIGKHIESVMSISNKMMFHTYFYPYIQLYGHVNEMYLSFKTRDRLDLPVLLNGVRHTRDGETVIDCVVVAMRKRIEHEKDILQTKTKLEELYLATNEANKKLELLHEEYEIKQQELMKLNDQLEALASTDPLTGLKNRRFLQESLLANIAQYQQSQLPFSLCIIDIDHFKKINDTYGHPVGDLILSSLAQLLQSLSYEEDTVARFGGEEFVILLSGTDQEAAIARAEQYRAKTEAASWDSYKITISIGIATVTKGDSLQSLLDQADQALYTSKSDGRNRVTHAEKVMRAQ